MKQFCIVFVGPSRAGKTSLLTSMYDTMENEVQELGWTMSAEPTTRGWLNDARKKLKGYAHGPELIPIEMGIEGTSIVRDFDFTLKENKKDGLELQLRCTDVPGGLYVRPDQQEYPKAKERIEVAHLFVVAVDAVALMEKPDKSSVGQWHDEVNEPIAIHEAYKADMSGVEGHHVLFVLCKAETYLAKSGGREAMEKAFKKGYKELLGFLDTTKSERGVTTSWCAVQTVGSLHLKRIVVKGGVPVAEFFRHKTNEYAPLDCDLPLRHALKLWSEKALEEARKRKTNVDVWWRQLGETFGIPTDLGEAKATVERFTKLLKEISDKIDSSKLIEL